jgi:AraC-like DNA-binding protein
VVPAGVPHRLESPQGYAQFGINLRAKRPGDAAAPASANGALAAVVDAAFDRPFTLRGSPILDLLPEIEDADRRDTTVSRLVLRNLLDRALLLCVECRQKQRGGGAFKERVLRELETDPARALSLEALADRLALSPTHVERLCRRYFSCGAITLMNRLKMGRARVWLAATELTIGEISDRLGFLDQSYFTRVFKRHYGMTPSGFRAERYE